MLSSPTLYQALQMYCRAAPEAVALLDPGGKRVSYGLLWQQIESLSSQLSAWGIGRQDVLAIALPNGPDLVTAFLAAAAVSVAAPLNPDYRVGEFAYYLDAIGARALLVQDAMESEARTAAQERGVPVLELATAADGTLTLRARVQGPVSGFDPATTDAVALLLHTSGTTSRPKLAPLTHGNLYHAAQSAIHALQLTDADRCLNVVPQFHIHGLMAGALAPLLSGGSVVCAPQFDAARFFDWLASFEPTWYTAAPAIHRSILARAAYEVDVPDCLRFIRSSSSPLTPPVMADLEALFGAPVIEVYGMTEASSQIAANPLPPGHRKPGSVGLAAGPEVAIMDPQSAALMAAGQVGEIVVRGLNVMSGYLHDAEANIASFTDDWFRTGDLGHVDEDGYLYISGRLKELIDRGGEKISPFEIDKILTSHPGVAEAVTFGAPHPVLGEEIAAAVVLKDSDVTESALQQFVSQRLADFKTPRRILILDAIPLSATGKVSRSALAERLGLTAEWFTATEDGDPVPPATKLEKQVARLWRDVLRLPDVAANQHFLELGGNSILAAQLVARIQQAFRVNVSLVDFFDAPTVAAQAAILEGLRQGGAIERFILPEPLQEGETVVRASFSQEHLWFLQQLNPGSTLYNLAKAYRLSGRLDASALKRSLHEVAQRHESLRTTLRREDGQLVQVIHPAPLAELEIVDLSHLPPEEQEATAYRLAVEDASTPFDLAQGPLLRSSLLRLAEDDHVFLFNMHHIITDGWSINIFRRELSTLYTAIREEQPVSLPELPVQYRGFTIWQRRQLQQEQLQNHVSYWKERLTQFPHTLDLPTDRPRPALESNEGAYRYFSMSKPVSDAVDALCRMRNVTRFMVMSTALNVLLYHYTGQEKILLGVPSANRVQPNLEGVIGFFVNTLVLPTDLSGNPTARQLLARVRRASFEAFEHQDLPFSQIVEAVQPSRDLSRHPLFQVMLVMVNFARDEWALNGVDFEQMKTDQTAAKFDLTLYLFQEEEHDSLQARFEYNRDLFDETTIVRLWSHLEMVLVRMTGDLERRLSELSPLAAAERRQMLLSWNDTHAAHALDVTITELFEAQTARTPAAAALLWRRQTMSYESLNLQANRLARALYRRGLRPGDFAGVFLERSPELVVSLLAILKVGAAFVPLDPTYPARRLAYMLADATPRLIVTREALAPRLPENATTVICVDADAAKIGDEFDGNLPPVATDIAYLIYTSGSTGRPKGVLGRQRGLVNRLQWMWETLPYAGDEVACLKTSSNFVDSIAELFGPLLQGVPAVIVSDEAVRDPALLVETLEQHHVTRLVLVPSLLAALLDSGVDLATRLPHMRIVVSSGETLSVRLCRRFHAAMPRCRLLNLYGMSEVAADVTWYDTAQLGKDAATTPIGRPIANTAVYILDAHLNPLPVGVTGELYAGGAGLAAGYHRKPELTAERFIANPFLNEEPDGAMDRRASPPVQPAVLYKTGDLARYRPDGVIDYVGRSDNQVKLRGYRIELGEIAAALMEHEQVREAAVVVQGMEPQRRLAAFVTVGDETVSSGWQLRRFLEKRLPYYMLPADVTVLQQLPLAPGGKVDRSALAGRERAMASVAVDFVAPETDLERQLAAIWAEVLGLERVGIYDNFFDLGGHSLLALHLLGQIMSRLGLSLPLMALFRAPTVVELAQLVEQDEDAATWSSLAPLQPLGDQTPFFCVHGVTGDVLWFAELARRLAPARPFYGLQARGLDGLQSPLDSIEDMASSYLQKIRTVQPEGAYLLGGASFGGMVAYEMAQQLAAQGEAVARLVMFDFAPAPRRARPLWHPQMALKFLRNLPHWMQDASTLSAAQLRARVRRQARVRAVAAGRRLRRVKEQKTFEAGDLLDYAGELPQARRRLVETHVRAIRSYEPQPYRGRIHFIRAQSRPLLKPGNPESGWKGLALDGVDVTVAPGSHEGMFRKPHVPALAELLKKILGE